MKNEYNTEMGIDINGITTMKEFLFEDCEMHYKLSFFWSHANLDIFEKQKISFLLSAMCLNKTGESCEMMEFIKKNELGFVTKDFIKSMSSYEPKNVNESAYASISNCAISHESYSENMKGHSYESAYIFDASNYAYSSILYSLDCLDESDVIKVLLEFC